MKTHELLASNQSTIGGNVSKLLTTFSIPIIWWNIMFSYFCKTKIKKPIKNVVKGLKLPKKMPIFILWNFINYNYLLLKWILKKMIIFIYNILGFVRLRWWWSSFPSIRPVIHPVIHPSKFLIPEEEDDAREGGGKTSCSLAICQKLQTNFKKLKIIEKKMRNKRRNLFKTTQEISY